MIQSLVCSVERNKPAITPVGTALKTSAVTATDKLKALLNKIPLNRLNGLAKHLREIDGYKV